MQFSCKALNPIFLGTTKVGEMPGDGDLYYDLMFGIKSYNFEDYVLYFHCILEEINYTLTFKKLSK
jgi:hypothetical protein